MNKDHKSHWQYLKQQQWQHIFYFSSSYPYSCGWCDVLLTLEYGMILRWTGSSGRLLSIKVFKYQLTASCEPGIRSFRCYTRKPLGPPFWTTKLQTSNYTGKHQGLTDLRVQPLVLRAWSSSCTHLKDSRCWTNSLWVTPSAHLWLACISWALYKRVYFMRSNTTPHSELQHC